MIGSFTYVNAAEINIPGFTGTMNTTVTSGFSIRTERNCLGVRGEKTLGAGDTGGAFAAHIAQYNSSNASVYLDDGEGCASRYTDGYGNVGSSSAGARNLISFNADNGRTNYDAGDIFDVTQRLYSEITGTTDAGTGVNISFVGRYNPLIDIAGNPDFAPFNTEAQDEIETNIDLLNAYITQDVAALDAEITAGRFVTNWGESTFIPIGMNGLTTNALDLTSLRVPGSSIKEALIPTEQITLSGYLDSGWSYEAYYQFGESHVELEEDGQFFGSDAVNGTHVIFTGQFANNSHEQATACNYYWSVQGGQGCTATAIANYNTASGKAMSDVYYIQEGMKKVFSDSNATALIAKSAVLGGGAAAAWGGVGGEIPVLATTGGAVAAGAAAWNEYDRKQGIKRGSVDLTNKGHAFADGDDQYGFALRTYLDDVGTGVDLGIYFAQYDSKVPYLRFEGKQGVTSGDLLGLFTLASKMASGSEATLAAYLSNAGPMEGTGAVTLTATETAGLNQLLAALGGSAYGEGACGAYQNPAAATAMYGARPGGNFGFTAAEKSNALTAFNYTAINGKLYHDSSKCAAHAAAWDTADTQAAAAALLGAAITPLNVAEAEFIYPENIQVLAVSANTNIGGTTVQAEIAYRPDFPLATDAGDQGQQLSDATGASTLLTQAVAKGAYDGEKTAVVTAAYDAGNGVSGTTFANVLADIKNFKRSTLPAISLATVAAGDYYTTPYIEYDTWTGTLGTTSTFTASHPITVGLGADSTVFLTELGIVHVVDLDDAANGGVGRGGYRDGVGGDKCGGITKGGSLGASTFNSVKALDGMTHLGSSQTDPLFGNGSYCESQNSIDATSMTYRLIGSASYNNVANSAWTFSPSFVWSHDFSGFGPSSMGGFVPGKQSLSLSGSLSKGDVRASVNYVNQLGDEKDNLAFDMDYVSASVSYAF